MQLTITELGEDGDGLARQGNSLYVVPGAVVGDVVAITESEIRGKTPWAKAFTLLQASPARRAPFCRHLACGGCALRDWSTEGAAKAKQQRVAAVLARAGFNVDVPPVIADGALAYRHRVRLHAEGRTIGYRRARSHDVLPLADCPVLEPPFAEALQKAVAALGKANACFGELDAVFGEGELALSLTADRKKAPEPMLAVLRQLVEQGLAKGAILAAPKLSRRVGEPRIVRAHPSFSAPARFSLEPGVFSQANWAMNARLVAAVTAAVPEKARVTELHAGAGNFTLPLSARQKVWASEVAEPAVVCARRNAEAHQVTPTLAVCQDKDALDRAPVAEILLLDPPRAGAKVVCEQLSTGARFERVVYVSCDVSSLVRDAKILAPAFTLREVSVFDMFPGTPHIEMLAVFTRSAAQ